MCLFNKNLYINVETKYVNPIWKKIMKSHLNIKETVTFEETFLAIRQLS